MATRKIAISIKLEGTAKASGDFNRLARSEKNTDTATKQLNNSLRSLNSSLKRLEPSTRKVSQLQKGLTNSFIKGNLAARGLSMAISTLTSTFRFGVGGAVAFEFSMAKVSAIAGITGETLSNLEREIRDIAAVSPKTAAEVADAALAMAKLGLSGEEVQDALEGVISLSVALDESVDDVGRTLVNVKNVFQKEASELQNVSDQLFKGFSKSALDLEKFATAFSFAGGTAKLAGVEFEQLVGLMGTLSNAGIRASTIGTQLRKIFVELDNASSKAGKSIGGETIKTIGLSEALRRLAKQQLSTAEIKELFGQRAISVTAALLQNIDAFEKLTKEVENSEGATAKAAKTLTGTLLVAWKELSSAFTEINIVLSELYGPAVISGLQRVAKLVRDIAASIGETSLEKNNALRAFLGLETETPEGFSQFNKNQDEFINGLIKAKKETQERLKAQKELEKLTKDEAAAAREAERLQGIQNALTEIARIKQDNQLAKLFGEPRDLDKTIERLNTLAKTLRFSGTKEGVEGAISAATLSRSLLQEQPEFGPRRPSRDPDFRKFREAQKEQEKLTKAMLATRKKSIEAIIKQNEKLEEQSFKFKLIEAEVRVLDGAIGSLTRGLSENLVGAIFDVQTAYVDFGEIFKGVTVQLLSQLTKLLVKMAIFKIAFAALGGSTTSPVLSALTGVPLAPLFGPGFANGFTGVVNQPTPFIAGEAGPERLTVTPAAKTARTGNGATINVTIGGDVYGAEKFMEAVRTAQQEINRRNVSV